MERIDHVILKTDNLHQAVEEFSEAGFHVFYGTKKEKAYNALVYLQDHSMIELLRTTAVPPFARVLTKWGVFRLFSPIFNRLGNFYFKKGPIIDYPVHSSQIESFYQRVKHHSSKLKTNARRKKPNGVTVSWRLFMPKNLDFPFVITDYEPEKISDDETNIHPNGIEGVQTLKIEVAYEISTFRKELKDFYGIPDSHIKEQPYGFDVLTANAIVEYRKSTQNKIRTMVLHPYVPTVDEKLAKYGITTANKEDIAQKTPE